MDINDAEVMSALTKMCLRQATEDLAKYAERFALDLPKDVDGRMALISFAAAIRSTNAKVWPEGAA